MDKPSLDKIYTADEAAERLRTTRRMIIKVGRELGACSVADRAYQSLLESVTKKAKRRR